MSRGMVENLVGALVLAVAIVSVYLAFEGSNVQRSSGYEIEASFADAGSLAAGTDVRLAGVKIGSVADYGIDPESFEARVTLTVDSAVKLPTDSSVRIVPDGLLGGNFIEITPGGAAELVEPGGTLTNTRGAVNVVELVSRIVTLAVEATAAEDSEEPAQ